MERDVKGKRFGVVFDKVVERCSCFWKSMEDWWSVFFVSFPLPDRQGQETVDDETLKAMSPLKSARFFD